MNKSNGGIKELRAELNRLRDEIDMLRTAISETINENGHLADGDVCTLIKLKRVMPETEERHEKEFAI
jgi:hypothetical protein